MKKNHSIYYITYYKGNESKNIGPFKNCSEATAYLSKIFVDLSNREDSWKSEPVMKCTTAPCLLTKDSYWQIYSLSVNEHTQDTIQKMYIDAIRHNIDVICNNGFDWEYFEMVG